MEFVRYLARPLTPLITLAFIALALTVPTIQAKMVSTQTMIEKKTIDDKRSHILKIITRTDVQKIMKGYGISPSEAQSRINSLTDQEVLSLSKNINNMPVGAGGEVFLLLLLIVIILEATGVTNIFTFM